MKKVCHRGKAPGERHFIAAKYLSISYGKRLSDLLGESMIEANQYEEAEAVLTGLKEEEFTPVMKVLIEFDFGFLYTYKTQVQEARQRYTEAVVLAEWYQIPNGAWMQSLYQATCESVNVFVVKLLDKITQWVYTLNKKYIL